MEGALDTATLFAGNAITSVAAAIAMAYVWRVHARESAVRCWALGFFCVALASLSMALRPSLPLWLSVFGVNYFGIASTTLMHLGTARFLGRPSFWRLLTVTHLFAVIAVAWFLLVHDVMAYRTLAYTVGSVPTLLLMTHNLWASRHSPQRLVFHFLALLWLLIAVLSLLRAGVHLEAHLSAMPDRADLSNKIWIAAIQAVMLLACVGQLLMTSQRLQMRLDVLASSDELTGTLNRRAFLNTALRSFRKLGQGAHSSLLVIDLDRFKAVNDRYGHACGDAVLKQTAVVLRNCLRRGDLLARAGGEEFWVLLPDTPDDAADAIAEDLRTAVAENTIECAEQQMRVSISIGCTTALLRNQAQLEDALLHADRALYAAKAAGRNCVIRA